MKPSEFYSHLLELAGRDPLDRHRLLAALHDRVLAAYPRAVQSIDARAARTLTPDGRTLAQVVGHIAEWDRFTIVAAGQMLAGVRWPQIMSNAGYVEPDGRTLSFHSVDEFKAYLAARHAGWPWSRVQNMAVQAAVTLHSLFVQPGLLTYEVLGQTAPFRWPLPSGVELSTTAGWYLWMVSLEHEGIEHADDLGLGNLPSTNGMP